MTFSELIDRLITVNIKLYNLLDETAELDRIENKSQEQRERIVKLSGDNVKLAITRSNLKSAIDIKLKNAVKSGRTEVLDECKKYGK